MSEPRQITGGNLYTARPVRRLLRFVRLPADLLNPNRTEDTALQQIVQRLARDLGQDESVLLSRLVPILVLRARCKEAWQRIDQRVGVAPALGITVVRTAGAVDARRHRGQMPQSDGRVVFGEFRIVVLCERVECALAVVDQQSVSAACERFRHRPYTLPSIGLGALPDHSPVANDYQPLDSVVRHVFFEPGDSFSELRGIDALRFRRSLFPTLPGKDHLFRGGRRIGAGRQDGFLRRRR